MPIAEILRYALGGFIAALAGRAVPILENALVKVKQWRSKKDDQP